MSDLQKGSYIELITTEALNAIDRVHAYMHTPLEENLSALEQIENHARELINAIEEDITRRDMGVGNG